jgi:chromosome segregation ATPase
MLKEKIA